MSGLRRLRRSITEARELQRAAQAGDESAAQRLAIRHPGIRIETPPEAVTQDAALRLVVTPNSKAGGVPATRFAERGTDLTGWRHAAGLAAAVGVGLVAGTRDAGAMNGDTLGSNHEIFSAGDLLVSSIGFTYFMGILLQCSGRLSQDYSEPFASWRRTFTWPLDYLGETLGFAADAVGTVATVRASEQRGPFLANTLAGFFHGAATLLRASGPIMNPLRLPTPQRTRNTDAVIASGLAAGAGFLNAGHLRLATTMFELTRWRVNRTATPEALDHLAFLAELAREHQQSWRHHTRTIVWAKPTDDPNDHYPAATHATRDWLRDTVERSAPLLTIADRRPLRIIDTMFEEPMVRDVVARLQAAGVAPETLPQ